jgi:hypothetical protein
MQSTPATYGDVAELSPCRDGVPRSRDGSILAASERAAQRIAEVLLAVMGPVFWLAIALAIVAATLGPRPIP